jgi:ATP-binding protein involved in chromosome partitioning
MSIREGSDAGAPPVAVAPDGAEALAYRQIARRLISTIP